MENDWLERDSKAAKTALVVSGCCLVAGLAFWSFVIYAAIHFLLKLW